MNQYLHHHRRRRRHLYPTIEIDQSAEKNCRVNESDSQREWRRREMQIVGEAFAWAKFFFGIFSRR